MDPRSCSSRDHRWRCRTCGGSGESVRIRFPAAQEMQKDRDPPPGAENINKRAERAQSTAPMSEGREQKPADAPGQKPGKSGAD
jgi:hypothetical protein